MNGSTSIGVRNRDWEIVGETLAGETLLYWAPNGENLPLPPQTGWQAVDERASGNLKVDYIFGGGAKEE